MGKKSRQSRGANLNETLRVLFDLAASRRVQMKSWDAAYEDHLAMAAPVRLRSDLWRVAMAERPLKERNLDVKDFVRGRKSVAEQAANLRDYLADFIR
jgi:hypothetical protein